MILSLYQLSKPHEFAFYRLKASPTNASVSRKRFPPLSDFKSPSSVTAGFTLPPSDNTQQPSPPPSLPPEPKPEVEPEVVEGTSGGQYEQQSFDFDGGLMGITLEGPDASSSAALTHQSGGVSVAGGGNSLAQTNPLPTEVLPVAPLDVAEHVESGAAPPSTERPINALNTSPGVLRFTTIL